MMRKLFLVIVALALCVGLLTACGKTNQSVGGPGGSHPPNGTPPSGQGGGNTPPGGGGFQTETNGTSATTLSSSTSKSGATYASTKTDQNALRVQSGAKVSLSNVTITKTGNSSNTNNSDFYGMNAGILVRDKSDLTLTGGSITTDAAGGNGLFVYNTGSTATVSGTKIRTSSNNSGGIEVAGGGSITASDLDIITQGNSAAAIRSDRGGGTLKVTGGSYVTNGTGSPAVYSTANINVADAMLIAHNSEGVVIEGNNAVALTSCTVTGAMKGTYGSSSGENIHSIMIYQSMSGDAAQGGGSFSATGGKIIGTKGDLFYVTNTIATINLTDVMFNNAAGGNLLTVAGNNGSRGWGTAGSNGGKCTLTASKQTLAGTISVDKISSLDLILKNGSTFTGTVNATAAAGTVRMTLASGCKWVLTGNAHLSSFSGSASSITTGGHHVYVNGKQLV